MRLIDADELRKVMYHEAFETDSDMQKWDGGCWIRYKMFEKAIDSAPTIEAEPVVRCKDCEFYTAEDRWCRRLGLCGAFGQNDYCSHAERRADETN